MLFIEKGNKKHQRYYLKNFKLPSGKYGSCTFLMGNNGVKATMIFLNISFDPYFNFEKLIYMPASSMYNHMYTCV